MPTHQSTHAPAQRGPSLATGAAGRDHRAEAWAAPGSLTACGQLLYKGKESELLHQHALRAGHHRASRHTGGPYAQISS